MLETEHDNFRSALEHAASAMGSREVGLRLVHALYPLWVLRSHRAEGRQWMKILLEGPGTDSPMASPVARRAGILTRELGDLEASARLFEQALSLARQRGDRLHLGRALTSAANLAMLRGDLVAAGSMAEEGLELAKETGDLPFLSESLLCLGWASWQQWYARGRPGPESTRSWWRRQRGVTGTARRPCTSSPGSSSMRAITPQPAVASTSARPSSPRWATLEIGGVGPRRAGDGGRRRRAVGRGLVNPRRCPCPGP